MCVSLSDVISDHPEDDHTVEHIRGFFHTFADVESRAFMDAFQKVRVIRAAALGLPEPITLQKKNPL